MRKELSWAIGIGIFFGLIIAFGAWRINTSSKKEPITTEASPTPSVATSEFKIVLDKPEQDDVVTQSSITVSGITKALAWITISGEKGDTALQAGQDGGFSQNIDLISGVNQIKVTAFDPAGAQSIEKVLVVYSSAFQVQNIPSPSPSDNSTESAIRQKVAADVAAALNNPKAYIGVVTDIADSTVQIKTTDGQIRQISTSDDGSVTVINSKGTTTKTIKLTDIAIGDFIVAMGYVNSKSVLAAQRILVTDPVTEPKIDAYLAKVSDVSKKSITVSGIKDGEPQTVTPGTKTDIESFDSGKLKSIKLANISDNDLIIYVVDSSSDTPTVRSIFVVQKPQS